MKPLWCWRCKATVAGLEDDEYRELYTMYEAALRSIKIPKQGHAPDPPEVLEERLAPVREAYRRITGQKPAPKGAWLHHALSQVGPPCGACGRPLRTPKASFCAACGATRAT